MYVKINGSDKKYYDIQITFFTTDKGNSGIVLIGDIPHTNKGFVVYEDDDTVNTDLSAYIYQYGIWENEYTTVEEVVDYGKDTNNPLPPSAFDRLSQRVSALNNQVNAITPYTETKTVYIGDKECIFDKVVNGNISAYLEIGGEQMPCVITVSEKYITVAFEEAEDLGLVTISIL